MKKFDLGSSITHLNFSNFNSIASISHLSHCKYLKTLNLSHNTISKIEGLNNLKQLQRLDLSYNRITKIQGLNTCKALIHLNLSFNLVTDINDLLQLTTLSELKDLNLLGNPLAPKLEDPKEQRETYLQFAKKQIPSLRFLDGEPIIWFSDMVGSDFWESKIRSKEKEIIDSKVLTFDRNSKQLQFEPTKEEKKKLIDSEKDGESIFNSMKKMILECKKTISRADQLMSEVQEQL